MKRAEENENNIDSGAECLIDEDCVPTTCCHATECTSKEKSPDCSDIACTLVCSPLTLDCGDGGCECYEGKCKAFGLGGLEEINS